MLQVPDRFVVILDDRFDVWESTSPLNVLRVPRYTFWNDTQEVDKLHDNHYASAIARMEVLSKFDQTDTQLSIALGVLTEVHSQFYAASGAAAAAQPSVKDLLPARRRSVLAGVHVCFSRCFDLRYDVRQNELWLMAEAFGATCHEKLSSGITHVVAKKYGTAKVNQANKKEGVSVVHLDWLRDSIKHWRALDTELFKLNVVLMRAKRAPVNWAWFAKVTTTA